MRISDWSSDVCSSDLLAFCHSSTTDNTDDKRAAMPSVSFVRASLLLAVAMLLAGAGLQSTLLSIRAGIEDFPIVVTGLVMSAYYAGYIVGSTVCGPLVYRVGHIRAFAAFAAIASAVPLLHGLSEIGRAHV